MAMQRFEDMDNLDIESMVSVMLEDHKAPVVQYPIPKLGDADGLWNMLNANKPSSGKSSFALLGLSKGGFRRGELNIICVGGRTR